MTPEDIEVLTQGDIDELAQFFELLARYDAEDKAKTEGIEPCGPLVVESSTDKATPVSGRQVNRSA
jgi:hypothetical protein